MSVSCSTITLTVQYVDDEANVDELIDGNTNFIVTAVPAATSFVSASWGTPVISGGQAGS